MIKKPIPISFDLDSQQSVQSCSAVIHIEDNRTEMLDLSLLQGGEHIKTPSNSTVTARFVRIKDKILISDNVACAVQENGNILIPIDNAAAKMLTGEIKIEVNITDDNDILTTQFPLVIRINNTILADSEISPESEGTFPELLEETKRIAAQALETVEGATEALGEIDSKISAIAPDEIVYDDIAYHDEDAPASTNHLLVFFGAASEPNISLNLPPLTSADFGKIFHFEISFKQANMSKVQLQENKSGTIITYAEYTPITAGETISFDYTMSAKDITGFRMRMFENAGAQKVKVKITKDVSVEEYAYPKSVFETEPVYAQKQGESVSGWAIINTGLPSQISGTSILIADVEGGEKLKISGRPAVAKIYYCSFFSEDIEFDSSLPNGGFSSEYFIGGLRNTEATSIENYVDILVTAPENAKKVIVSGSNSFAPSVYSETGKQLKRKWSGKKWCAVGDSLTEKNNAATKNYTDYIAEATGIEVINMGQSGTGYKQEENRGHAFYQRINEVPTDSDVVTIFGSLNDAGYIYNQITIPWNTAEPRKVINANGEIVSGGASNSYIVSEPIPAISGRYYRIKTRMRGANAFFVFKDANNEPLYVEKLVNADGTYPTDYSSYLDYDGYVKAPKYAKYLYISSSVNGNATYTYAAEDNLGTVDDGLVLGDVPNGQETENYTTTLCGCINSTINNLYKIMPTVNLGIISSIPWIQYNAFNSPSCILYIEALEAICKKRGIPFLNLFYESNLRPWNQEFINLMYKHGNHDHPDEDAHKLFAPRIEAFLDKLLLH